MKRFTALLLLVLLAIAPFSASLADYPTSVTIWGMILDGTNQYYVNGANGVAGTVFSSEPDNWNARYNPQTGVLTLKNLNVKNCTDQSKSQIAYFGIYAGRDGGSPDDLTIELIGENIVSSGENDSSDKLVHSNAIHTDFVNLTIIGSGKLTAIGGKTNNGNSVGIYVNGNLIINGGVVSCKGGATGSFDSYGVHMEGSLEVLGGTLTGAGGTSSSNSYGVKAHTITASGGSIKGTGGTASTSSKGVCTVLHDITVNGGSITGIGGKVTNSNSDSVSAGVYGIENITVENGSLTGVGDGSSTSSYGISANTAQNYSITLNTGAVVLAKGKSSALNKAPTLATDVSAWASTNYNGSGAGDYIRENNADYKYFRTLETIPALQLSVSPQPIFPYGQAPGNETVTINSNLAGFNAINNFDSATMDGRPIDLGSVGASGAHGSVSDGSIVIQLNKAYLDTLTAGTHTLCVNLTGVYIGQYVETQITVLPSGGDISAGGDVGPDVPKTGDAATPALWLGLMLLAGAGIAVSTVRRRKRQNG